MNSARLTLAATLCLSLSLGATRSAHAILVYSETTGGDLPFSFSGGGPFANAPNLGALAAGQNVFIGSVPAPNPQTDVANEDQDSFLVTIPANFTFDLSLTVSNFVDKLPITGGGNDVGSDDIRMSLFEGAFGNDVAGVQQSPDGTSSDGPFGPFATDTQLLGYITGPQAVRQILNPPFGFDFQNVGGGDYELTITLTSAAAVPEARAWLMLGVVTVGAVALSLARRRGDNPASL